MKRFVFAGAGALMLGLALVFAACSDNSVDPLPAGNPNDPNFQIVNEEVAGQVFDGVDLALGFSTALVDSIPAPTAVRSHLGSRAATYSDLVFDNLDYALTNDWHIFNFQGYAVSESLTDTVDVSGVDSIQLLAAGTPITYPDETMDELIYNVHFSAANRAGTASREAVHRIDLTRVNPQTQETGIDGTVQEVLTLVHADSAGTCDLGVNVDFTADHVVIDFAGNDCPVSGSVNIALALSADCSGGGLSLAVDGNWSIAGHYTASGGAYTISDGEHVWLGVDDCGSGGAQSVGRFR
jgi:hypothetical protein